MLCFGFEGNVPRCCYDDVSNRAGWTMRTDDTELHRRGSRKIKQDVTTRSRFEVETDRNIQRRRKTPNKLDFQLV